MNIAGVKKLEVENGTGIGLSLFVSGCPHKCKGCHNEQAWDKFYGEQYKHSHLEEIIKFYKDYKYVKRFTVLGGEPLWGDNAEYVASIIRTVKLNHPHISIWVYTGYTFEELKKNGKLKFLKDVDFLVDGRFVAEQKDISIKFRGSKNQRILNVKESLKENVAIIETELVR